MQAAYDPPPSVVRRVLPLLPAAVPIRPPTNDHCVSGGVIQPVRRAETTLLM